MNPNHSLFQGKYCANCRLFLGWNDFHKDKKSPDGRCSRCKSCVKTYQQQLRSNPPQKDLDSKRCPRCGITKPRSDFALRANKKWLRSRCRQCETAISAEWHHNNKEKARVANRRITLQRYYGLSVEEYEHMLRQQGGVCAICGTAGYDKRQKYLCVDHDHATGAIRGLLCGRCNFAVGFFCDNPEFAGKMIEYLQSHSSKPPESLRFISPKWKGR
jgi:hypothetical protein